VVNASLSFGSGVFACWAKVGKAKPIAKPTRAGSKHFSLFAPFIDFFTLTMWLGDWPHLIYFVLAGSGGGAALLSLKANKYRL